MTRRIITAIALIALACCTVFNAQDAMPTNGLLSPEESLAYIQGLSNRKFFEECLQQANEFSLRYPKHPFAESVDAYRIQALYALQRYDETASAIKDFLTLYPKSEYVPEFRWTQAESYFNAKKYSEAVAAYEDVIKQVKKSHQEDAHYRLAICLVEMDRKDEALEHLQQLSKRKPDAEHLPRIYASQYLAIMKQNEGENEEALNLYLPLLEVPRLPDDLRMNLLLSAAYLAFTPPIQNYQKAAEFYGTVLAEFPNDPSVAAIRKNLLSCHFALGNYKNYLALFAKYSQNSKVIASDTELLWLAAQANVATEHYKDSLPILTSLIEDSALNAPLRQKAMQTAIIALDALNEDEKLIVLAKQYREDYPTALDSTDVLQRAANAETRSGNYPEAIADYRQLLPLLAAGDPIKYQTVGKVLATLLDKIGDYSASANLFLELAEKAPETTTQKDYTTKRDLRKTALTPLFQLKDDPRGLAIVTELCASPTDNDELLTLLKLKYQFAVNSSKYDIAIAAIGEILEKTTPAQQPNWLVARAKINRNFRRYSQTADDYLKALAHPECPKALRSELLPDLITLLYYTKRQKEAAPFLQEIFSLNPQPRLSEALLFAIAKDRCDSSDFTNARKAYGIILADKALSNEKRDFYSFMLADTEVKAGDLARAKELLNAVEQDRTRRDLQPNSDCSALFAEIAILEDLPDVAIVYAKQALEGTDKTASQDTLPRARWALAQAYLQAGDYKSAFSIASQGFILGKHPVYAPKCYQVASKAKELLGDKRTAQELQKNLREEYPDFK